MGCLDDVDILFVNSVVVVEVVVNIDVTNSEVFKSCELIVGTAFTIFLNFYKYNNNVRIFTINFQNTNFIYSHYNFRVNV